MTSGKINKDLLKINMFSLSHNSSVFHKGEVSFTGKAYFREQLLCERLPRK